jgi:type IV/VI secretion system ImpK/VasF family protein
MAGQDSGFGTAGGPPVPADPEVHDQALDDEHNAYGSEVSDPFTDEADDVEIPRHTKPFRAWGAAHEDEAPSIWQRFKAWLSGLFGRDREENDVDDEEFHFDESVNVPLSDEPVATLGFTAPAAVLAEPHPEAEDAPRDSDFDASWDVGRKTGATTIDPIDEAPETTAEADPLWDAPQVSGSSAAAPAEVIDRGALDVVWTPSSAQTESEQDAELEEHDETKRPSFISRLFARRKKRQELPDEPTELPTDSPAAFEPAPNDFAEAPAPDDFAVSADASAEATAVADAETSQPTVDLPFILPDAEPPTAVPSFAPPSLDHSADDAAALASFLASGPPPAKEPEIIEVELEPTLKMPVVEDRDTGAMDLPLIEETLVEEEVVEEQVVEEQVVEEQVVEEPVAEAAVVDDVATQEMEEVPPPTEKKPGFFSRLFGRKPKPNAVETAAVEPEVVEAEVAEVQAVEAQEPEPEVREDDPAISSADESRWAPPPAPDASAEPEPESPPVPYHFVDARDDEPEPVAAISDARKTEELDQPVLDPFTEGETTDEFEVVPPAAIADATTATIPATPAPAGFLGKLFGKKDGETTLETTADSDAPQVVAPTSTIAQVSPKDDKLPFVLAKFRMFYNEIIRDKHQKSDVISGFATAIVSSSEAQAADPEFAAALLSKRLSEMLELQAAESNWTGGDAVKYYPEAQYAMVCLADETFLTIDWAGRSAWRKHMLEPRMYQTRSADTELFRRIDKLLRTERPEKGARDLARVYLLVIASGFRGLFREPNLTRPLAEYRRRLYEFSHGEDPLELYAKDRKIFPNAEEHILAGKAVGRFTAAQKWIAAVIILLIVYGAVSQLAWKKLSADLRDVMSRVETTAPGASK